MRLTHKETATVLCALRRMQNDLDPGAGAPTPSCNGEPLDIHLETYSGPRMQFLTPDEIDELCELINSDTADAPEGP